MKTENIAALVLLLASITPLDVAAQSDKPNMNMAPATTTDPRTAPVPSQQRQPVTQSRWRLGVALGYGLRTNPLLQSDDIPLLVDFDIAWFGDRFFFDNGDLGLTILDNDHLTASIVGRANSDRVFFGRTNTKFVTVGATGAPLIAATELVIPDRDYAAEMGLEILAGGRWGKLQFSVNQDVGNTHDGYQIFADYGYGWRNQRWYFEPSFGLSYKSADLNNYYWGVRATEASEALPAYEAGSGVNAHARLQFGYQISRQWSFALVSEFERLNGDAAASPIVKEQNVFGYFAGFGFMFR